MTGYRRTTKSAKPYHYAAKMRADGAVSALCFDPPRAINLRRASWTIRPEAVTCRKCLAVLAGRAALRDEESAP